MLLGPLGKEKREERGSSPPVERFDDAERPEKHARRVG